MSGPAWTRAFSGNSRNSAGLRGAACSTRDDCCRGTRVKASLFLMRNLLHTLAVALLLAASLPAFATVFATVHGVVHDAQHRPIAGATVTLQAADSDFALHATTNTDGEFELPEAPIGVYRLTITAAGFSSATQTLTVASGTNPVLHIPLGVAGTTQSVVVSGAANSADT